MIFPIVDLLYKHSIKDLPWIYVITELHWDFDGPAEPISGNFKERADVLFSGVEVGGLCSFLSESHTLPCASLVCKMYLKLMIDGATSQPFSAESLKMSLDY
jgi:hypothetical protein